MSKTIRMTESLRTDTTHAILADVPKVDYKSQIEASLRKYVEASRPQFVLQMLASPNAKQYLVTNQFNAVVSRYRINPYHHTTWHSVSVVGYAGKLNWDDAPQALKDEVQEWQYLLDEQESKRNELFHKLKDTLLQFKTVAQARKALPEFDKYFPKPEALPVQLPSVTSCVSALVEAGWDIVKNGTPSITSET